MQRAAKLFDCSSSSSCAGMHPLKQLAVTQHYCSTVMPANQWTRLEMRCAGQIGSHASSRPPGEALGQGACSAAEEGSIKLSITGHGSRPLQSRKALVLYSRSEHWNGMCRPRPRAMQVAALLEILPQRRSKALLSPASQQTAPGTRSLQSWGTQAERPFTLGASPSNPFGPTLVYGYRGVAFEALKNGHLGRSNPVPGAMMLHLSGCTPAAMTVELSPFQAQHHIRAHM